MFNFFHPFCPLVAVLRVRPQSLLVRQRARERGWHRLWSRWDPRSNEYYQSSNPTNITMIADRSQPTLMMKSKRRRGRDSRNLPARQNCAVCSPLSSGSEYIDSSLLHAIKSLAEAGPPSSSLSHTNKEGRNVGPITNIVGVVHRLTNLATLWH